MTTLHVRPVTGLPRLGADDDLAALLVAALGPDGLREGDVLCVSSKAVAKTEGRTRTAGRDDVVDEETERLVARRGPLRVVRTRQGLVLAAAGVDASNTEPGTVVPLPVDPDASARGLRARAVGRVRVQRRRGRDRHRRARLARRPDRHRGRLRRAAPAGRPRR